MGTREIQEHGNSNPQYLFIQLGSSFLQFLMRLGESSGLDGPIIEGNISYQGLFHTIGHLLVWDERARNLASLPLWVGIQPSSRLGWFVGFLQCTSHSHTS